MLVSDVPKFIAYEPWGFGMVVARFAGVFDKSLGQM